MSSSANLNEGTYLISEDEMNKKMRTFKKSDELNKFIKSKLDLNATENIYIDFEPKPKQKELVSAWLERSKGKAQILVSLSKTGNHISSIKLIVLCFELLKQSNDIKSEVELLKSRVAKIELDIELLKTAFSSREFKNFSKDLNDFKQASQQNQEMLIVSDMITNFYKLFVYINRAQFPRCIQRANRINLEEFYDRLSDQDTNDEIISKINSTTDGSAYDGLTEIKRNVRQLRNGICFPLLGLLSIDEDYRFDFVQYLSYLEGEVNKLVHYNHDGNFILARMRELVTPKQSSGQNSQE